MNINNGLIKSDYNPAYTTYKRNNNLNIKSGEDNSSNIRNSNKNKPQVSFTGLPQLFSMHDAVMCLIDVLVIYTACRFEAKHHDEKKEFLDKKNVRGAFFDHGASVPKYNAEKFYGSIHNALSEIDKLQPKTESTGILNRLFSKKNGQNSYSQAIENARKGFEKVLALSTEGILGKDISDKVSANPKAKYLSKSGAEGILEACHNARSYITTVAKSVAQNETGFYRETLKNLRPITAVLDKVKGEIKQICPSVKLPR